MYMATPDFELLYMTHPGGKKTQQYIHEKASDLKVIVWPLHTNPMFSRSDSEMCFYAKIDIAWYAFETAGIQDDQHELLRPALDWYAARVQCPDMHLQLIDPRTTYPLRHDVN